MTTNFALSLSFEGIELLHRVQHGWKLVGRADVEADDLDTQLTQLREKAVALAPDGLRTKLIVPLDQIKYIAIDSTQTTMDDIYAKLDGATPYALNELVIDNERFGGRTHIAAVAKETLTEAESFASAHGFNPVCFVAVPEPFTFQKEVFFGATSVMLEILGPDAEVDRDPMPVMVIGTRIRSRLLLFDLPEDALPPEEEFNLAAALAPHVSESQELELPTARLVVTVPLGSDDIDEPDGTMEPPIPDIDEVALFTPDVPEPEKGPEPEVEAAPEPVVVVAPAPIVPAPLLVDRVIPEFYQPVVEAPIITEEPAVVDEPVVVDSVAVAEESPVIKDAPAVKDIPAARPAVALVPKTPNFAVPVLMDACIPEVIAGQQLRLRRRRRGAALTARAPKMAHPLPALGAAESVPARPSTPVNTSKRPLYIAGGVAAGLVLVSAVAWSAMRPQTPDTPVVTAPEVVSQAQEAPAPTPTTIELIAAAPSVPQIDITGFEVAADAAAPTVFAGTVTSDVTRTAPAPITSLPIVDTVPAAIQPPPAPPVQEEVAAAVGAPVLRGRVLSPADASRIYAATGVWQRAPRFVDVPTETSTDGLIIPFSETVPNRLTKPNAPLTDDLATDLSFLPPADPPPADVQFPVDEDGFILATPEGTVTPEGAVVIAGAPDLTLRLRPELTQADLDRMSLLAPAPEGVVIIAGRPDYATPLRPANAALPEPQDETAQAILEDLTPPTAGGVALSGLQSGQTTDLAASADPALAGVRPAPRPGALASTAIPADPGTPDITSIIAGIQAEDATNALIGATPQAVAASSRPELRPRNFAQVVAAARARQAAQPTVAAAAPVQTAAPVAPQNYAPVPGGVARAATQDDVLPLRQINLIGVYGRPNARRALVRLSNGRYVRVEIGSTLDGGQVSAISETALNYVKRGRTLALQLPSG